MNKSFKENWEKMNRWRKEGKLFKTWKWKYNNKKAEIEGILEMKHLQMWTGITKASFNTTQEMEERIIAIEDMIELDTLIKENITSENL